MKKEQLDINEVKGIVYRNVLAGIYTKGIVQELVAMSCIGGEIEYSVWDGRKNVHSSKSLEKAVEAYNKL